MSDSVLDETESEIDMTQPAVQRGIGMRRARGKGYRREGKRERKPKEN